MGCRNCGVIILKIENLKVIGDGYVRCHSYFYSSFQLLPENYEFCFSKGINRLYGEIDSGNWAVSYLLSMYKKRSKDFTVEYARILVNDNEMKLEEFLKYSCYMDKLYPLFSTNKRIDQIVAAGISKNKLDCSPNDVRDMFEIYSGRFQRPLKATGNERFKMMAAIGYVYGKEVFCFPWMSQMRFFAFHGHLTYALEKLEQLGKTVILPLGVSEYDPDKV